VTIIRIENLVHFTYHLEKLSLVRRSCRDNSF